MSNIQRLSDSGNKSQKLFADTILTMKQSQGFYCRLYNAVNELTNDGLEQRMRRSLLDDNAFSEYSFVFDYDFERFIET